MMAIVFDDEVVATPKANGSRIVFDDEIPQPRGRGAKARTQENTESIVAQLMRGLSEIPRTIGEVPLAVGSGMVAPVLGMGSELVRQITGQNEGSPFGSIQSGQRAADVAGRYTYEPKAKTARDISGILNSGLGAVAPAFPAMLGGEMSAIGASAKAMMDRPRTPSPAPMSSEKALIAKKFQDMGGKVPLHALTDNPRLKMLGERLDTMPFAGSPREGNKRVINKELLKQIGGDESAGLLTPESYAPAMNEVGEGIGRLYGKADVPLFDIKTRSIRNDLSTHTADVAQVVNGFLDRIEVMGGENQRIPGGALRELDSKIGERIRGAKNSDMKGVLSEVQDALRSGLEKNLPESDVPVLRDLRTKYAKGMFLEPLVAKNNFEGVLPSDLMSRQLSTEGGRHRIARQSAGEMGDLATIGGKFLKDRMPLQSSGVMSSIGTAISTAVGAVPGQIYNRLGPKITARQVAQSVNPREVLGYSAKAPVDATPAQTGMVPYTHEGGILRAGENAYNPNWTYGRRQVDPDVQVSAGNPNQLEAPSYGRTIGALNQRRDHDLSVARDSAAREEAWQAQQENFYRQPTGRGTLLDIDPVSGKLRPASQGMKGATPDVIESTGHALNSAAEKLSRGEPATMTLLEKNAWNKAKVDIATIEPGFNALSDKAITGKIMDRQWVADAIVKAREKAAAFDEISKRATDAQKIRDAAKSREKMIELAESLDDQLRGGNPVLPSSQGPKTRAAIRNGILSTPKNTGILSEQ